MNKEDDNKITIHCRAGVPVEKAWQYWTGEEHIVHWNQAAEEWFTPSAKNDLRPGGRFSYRMEARDGSAGFDFEGEYTVVEKHREISSVLGDGRKVKVIFSEEDGVTGITETFEAETMNPAELQRQGWQAILNSFAAYAERRSRLNTLHFQTAIKAPAMKVHEVMLSQQHYSEWTSVFNPTSRYEGSWEKGREILFLGSEPDGSVGGMVSTIRENIPGKYVGIEHTGFIKNGVRIPLSAEAGDWKGARENYTFAEAGGYTQLSIAVDTVPKYEAYFSETWPQALEVLKNRCEA